MRNHYVVQIPNNHPLSKHFGEFFGFRIISMFTPEDMMLSLRVSPINSGLNSEEREMAEELLKLQMQRDKLFDEKTI